MSLVYDALRQQADPARPAPAPVRASWWSRRTAAARSGMLVGAGALLSVPVAFLLVAAGTTPAAPAPVDTGYPTVDTAAVAAAGTTPSAPGASDAAWPEPSDIATAVDGNGGRQEIRSAPPAQDPIRRPPVDAAVAQAPESLSPAAPAAAPDPLPTEVAAVTPDTLPAGAPLAAPPQAPTGANATIPNATASASATTSTSAPISIRVERRATAEAPAPGGDAMAVEETIRNIEAALAAGDAAGADHALATLGTLLHPDSLTLLRMRAWVAHGSNDMAAAEELYRRIAARVPDDVNAGVNIALLDAARGQVDDARSRLLRLSGRHARSPLVARALAELEALPQ